MHMPRTEDETKQAGNEFQVIKTAQRVHMAMEEIRNQSINLWKGRSSASG